MSKQKKSKIIEDPSQEVIKAINKNEKEMKANGKPGHSRYRIFRVEKDEKTGKETKITMTKFWAKNDAEAYKELLEYRKMANRQFTYYYSSADSYVDLDPKTGKMRYFDDAEELHKLFLDEDDTIVEKIALEFKLLWSKIADVKYWLRDVWFFIKTRHDYRESWQLDGHFVDDLEFNLPRIKKDKHGTPIAFFMKAAKILHKDDKNFNIDEYMEKNPQLDEEGLDKLASKLFCEEIDKCILYVKLYKYYSNYGIVDSSDKDQVEFDKAWCKTLPYLPGTYKEFDYAKLQALVSRNWNALMNWCKENLQYCWD